MAKSASEIDGSSSEQVASLPWRIDADGKLRILLVTSRTNAKWMLPKGWPISGNSAGRTAGIEAKEEAGVEGVASETAIGSYRFIKLFDDGTSTPAQALVFPLRVTCELSKWDEKGQRKRRWFRPKKAADAVFEPDLRRFLLDLREDALVLFSP
ncbi:MAG: NUDIX hydrolase [Candidatus Devosia phytovorans]|uniref:NUDIX hydrolase n=1 Tax=Candidatus Devosia phytovorans TaxID=3121372 RepID=A0AAJ5VTU5_9HYPH|nr:NUDIX hydrolase [Devosia sp.]WEK04708.1 MAG: NUDIX hydrolase [Devosia sp.]